MTTIVIKIKNKKTIPFLKKLFLNANVHESVEQGLYELKEILTGKKKGITIKELFEND